MNVFNKAGNEINLGEFKLTFLGLVANGMLAKGWMII